MVHARDLAFRADRRNPRRRITAAQALIAFLSTTVAPRSGTAASPIACHAPGRSSRAWQSPEHAARLRVLAVAGDDRRHVVAGGGSSISWAGAPRRRPAPELSCTRPSDRTRKGCFSSSTSTLSRYISPRSPGSHSSPSRRPPATTARRSWTHHAVDEGRVSAPVVFAEITAMPTPRPVPPSESPCPSPSWANADWVMLTSRSADIRRRHRAGMRETSAPQPRSFRHR